LPKKKNPEKSKNQYVLKTMPTSSLFSRQNRVKQINSYCKTKESFISASILKEKIMQDQKNLSRSFTHNIEHPRRAFFFFLSLCFVGGLITTLMAASNTALTFCILTNYSEVNGCIDNYRTKETSTWDDQEPTC